MSKSREDGVLVALQIMGSTVLVLRPSPGTENLASFVVERVGGDFTKYNLAQPGDLVHFIKLPASALPHSKGG